jgi:hypothetical protein
MSTRNLPKKRRVYLIECGGRYKVGVSENPERRVTELNDRPFPAKLITKSGPVHCAFEAEREIHEWLDSYRVNGEWFDIPEHFVESVAFAVRDVCDSTYGYEE